MLVTEKMYCYSLLTGLLVIFITSSATGQFSCPDITATDLQGVIANNLGSGDNTAIPNVNVQRFRPLCRAQSSQRDRYRYVSVVVEYTCTGNANCPSGTAVEQFESGCGSGNVWTDVVGSLSGSAIRTTNPFATFTTTARDDCSLCFSNLIAESFSLVSDTVTHCVGKFISVVSLYVIEEY